MNACSHLFVCKGVKQQSSKCSSVSCDCCLLDCSSEFFCTYVGQKPEMPRSFFFLPCAGVLWGWLVAFCGCWDGRPLFCHRTSCPMGEALSLACKTQVLHNSVQRLEARILPGPCLFRGSSVFWGGFVVLRWLLTFYEHLAKELVLSYLTIITIIIFNHINRT